MLVSLSCQGENLQLQRRSPSPPPDERGCQRGKNGSIKKALTQLGFCDETTFIARGVFAAGEAAMQAMRRQNEELQACRDSFGGSCEACLSVFA